MKNCYTASEVQIEVGCDPIFFFISFILVRDLAVPPGNRLEVLKGKVEGEGWHSMRIHDQWRIVFQWTPDGVFKTSIVDYH